MELSEFLADGQTHRCQGITKAGAQCKKAATDGQWGEDPQRCAQHPRPVVVTGATEQPWSLDQLADEWEAKEGLPEGFTHEMAVEALRDQHAASEAERDEAFERAKRRQASRNARYLKSHGNLVMVEQPQGQRVNPAKGVKRAARRRTRLARQGFGRRRSA